MLKLCRHTSSMDKDCYFYHRQKVLRVNSGEPMTSVPNYMYQQLHKIPFVWGVGGGKLMQALIFLCSSPVGSLFYSLYSITIVICAEAVHTI